MFSILTICSQKLLDIYYTKNEHKYFCCFVIKFKKMLPFLTDFKSTLFVTHFSCGHKPLTHPVNNPKIRETFSLTITPCCYLSIKEPIIEVPYSKP